MTGAPLPGGTHKTLRQSLLGAWHLRSYLEERAGTASPHHPLGADATGLLTYTGDGCVSVLMMQAGRPSFSSGDWFRPTPEELAAASAFIAYSGTFSVDEAARTVTHGVDVSFFPNWVGNRQVRLVELAGDDLTLTPTVPIMSGGQPVIPRVRWRRASAGARLARSA